MDPEGGGSTNTQSSSYIRDEIIHIFTGRLHTLPKYLDGIFGRTFDEADESLSFCCFILCRAMWRSA